MIVVDGEGVTLKDGLSGRDNTDRSVRESLKWLLK